MARFDRAIPPGGSGKIILSLDSTKIRGAFRKTATVQSNDPARPNLRLAIKGEVRRLVEVKPDRLFLRGYKEDQPRAIVTIISNQETPLQIKEVQAPELAEEISWKLKTLQEGKQYQIEVVNRAGVGRYIGKLVILTDSPQKPKAEVLVYGQITGDVGYYPTRLELGRLKAGTEMRPRNVTVWKNRGQDFKLGKVTYDKERFEVEINQQGPRYVIAVRPRLEKLKPGEFTSEVKIETTSSDCPELVVPVHGWVQ